MTAVQHTRSRASLDDSIERLRTDLRVIIVCIKKKSGEMMFNPEPDVVLEPDDILIAIGHQEQLTLLDELANPRDVKP